MASKLKCKFCKQYEYKENMQSLRIGNFCQKDDHAVKWAIENQAKGRKKIIAAKKKEVKKEKSVTRLKKKELMTRTEWYNRLQTLVNQFITKVRDVGKPCCTCGTTNPHIKYDSGHCFTKKARPDIRFDLSNLAKQCSIQCNVHGSGMRLEYKKFIVETYGPLELMRLELVGPTLKEQFPNWQDIELEIIRYRKILRDNGIKPAA